MSSFLFLLKSTWLRERTLCIKWLQLSDSLPLSCPASSSSLSVCRFTMYLSTNRQYEQLSFGNRRQQEARTAYSYPHRTSTTVWRRMWHWRCPRTCTKRYKGKLRERREVHVAQIHKRLLPVSGRGERRCVEHRRTPWKAAGKPYGDGVHGQIAAEAPRHAGRGGERAVDSSSSGRAHVEATVLHCIC
jgi:hypothetical protein